MKTEHILIIRFSAMGDVAMTVPVVTSLAHQYPNVRIAVLSLPYAEPFFENLAPNVTFMSADVRNEYHGIRGINTLFRRLTAKNFIHSKYLHIRFDRGGYNVSNINKHSDRKRTLIASENKILQQQPTSFKK